MVLPAPAAALSTDSEVPIWDSRYLSGAPVAPVSMNGQKITNVGAPSASTDAATKGYADAAVAALTLASLLAAATSAGTHKITDVVDPGAPQDAATRAYVDAHAGASAELDYVPNTTADTTVAATSEATAQVYITGNSITYDGSTAIVIHLFCGAATPTAGLDNDLHFVVWDDTANVSLGQVTFHRNPSAAGYDLKPDSGFLRITPVAGARVYSFRAYVSGGAGHLDAGAGGAGNRVPSFIRITRA